MNRFDLVEATFQPKRTDNLKPSAITLIGHRLTFRALWLMDDDDPYPGQYAMGLESAQNIDWYWVPEEDLVDIVKVERIDSRCAYVHEHGCDDRLHIGNMANPQLHGVRYNELIHYFLYVDGMEAEELIYHNPLTNDEHHRIMEYLDNRAINEYGASNWHVWCDYEL